MPKFKEKAMPRKPKRPCSFPGCPKLTEGRFCEEHEKEENKRYERYDRNPALFKFSFIQFPSFKTTKNYDFQ